MPLSKIVQSSVDSSEVLALSGIKFPSTQSASADANTLDDYEEGTWTPGQGSGLTVVGAFSSYGTYIKIGRLVTVSFRLVGATSVASSVGGALTSNLPFNTETVNSTWYWGSGANNSTGSTVIEAAAGTVYGISSLSATTNIYGSVTYITA